MKNNYHILLVAFLMCSTVVFAQQSGDISGQPRAIEEGKTVFNPHWFLSVQGGGAYTVGESATIAKSKNSRPKNKMCH